MKTMDFNKLLTIAQGNKHESQSEASVKRYSTVFAPAKKEAKSNVPSISVQKFLAKKEAEKRRKEIEDKRRKEQLLSLRSQNTKSNKAAKLMASRTKDNDFSRIKLTEDEVEEKKKREAEIMRLQLNDKRDRMKARIDMEEKDKMLPHKRKRKSKNPVDGNSNLPEKEEKNDRKNDVHQKHKHSDGKPSKSHMKPRPPPKPSGEQGLSFEELLKVAAAKQYEPVPLKEVKVETEKRPMTKKAKRLLMDEQNRVMTKLELKNMAAMTSKDSKAMLKISSGESSTKNQQSSSKKQSSVNQSKMKVDVKSQESSSSQPFVVRVQKDTRQENIVSKKCNDSKVTNPFRDESSMPQAKETAQLGKSVHSGIKSEKNDFQQKKVPEKKVPNKTMGSKGQNGGFSDEMMARIEEQIRSRLEKQFEEKLKALQMIGNNSSAPVIMEKPQPANTTNIPPVIKSLNPNLKPKMPFDTVKPNIIPPAMSSQVRNKPVKKPVKKKFHINPYMQPRRRLLEKTNAKKQIIPEEDDDMDDFIDDDDENYSKHIKKMFGYDRSRYLDDDEDDIIETSFAAQLAEERKSAILGYKEDIADIAKEKALKKKLKMKKAKS